MSEDSYSLRTGDMVRYDIDGFTCEYGIVVDGNPHFVFVRYFGDLNTKATRLEDLELVLDRENLIETAEYAARLMTGEEEGLL